MTPARKVSVTVECIGCKTRGRIFPGEVAKGDHPCCPRCGMPMIPILAKAMRGKQK